MSVIFGPPTHFKKLYMSVLTTLYEHVGDSDIHELSSVGLTSTTYDRRNYLLQGRFRVSYPGTDCPDDFYNTMGSIKLAVEDYRPVASLQITSLEDNTKWLCIMPIGKSRQVRHEFIPLVKDIPITATIGRLYVTDVGFKIADHAVLSGSIIDCSVSDKVIIPDNDGMLTAYSTVDKGNDPRVTLHFDINSSS